MNQPAKWDLPAVFRVTLRTYLSCVADSGHVQHSRKGTWSHPRIEFAADFEACVKRTLTGPEYRAFVQRYLQPWTRTCRRIDAIASDELERKLAKAFLTAQPHSLFPSAGYFGGGQHPAAETMKALAFFLGPQPVVARAQVADGFPWPSRSKCATQSTC